MTFNPHNLAAEEDKRQGALPLKLAKKGALIAGGLATAGASGILGKVLPFLNKYIPETLARKGLAKVLPKSEKFFLEAEKTGHTFNEARQFLSEKINPKQEEDIEIENIQPQNAQEAMTQNIAKSRQRQPRNQFNREGLSDQFEQGQSQGQGKEALLQTMQQITEALRRMRGNG